MSGCTHEHDLVPPRMGGATLERSQTKRIAIVMAEPAIKPFYETSTDGHTWVFRKTRDYYRAAFQSALAQRVATVEFFEKTAPPAGFDAYVYPTLSLEASGALPHQCKVQFSVAMIDGAGHPVLRKEASIEESFAAIADGERACTVAMTGSFNATAYPVLAALDGW